jgi:hypothetical protein
MYRVIELGDNFSLLSNYDYLSCFQDVQSRIRKGEKGLVVFAGDVTPIGKLLILLSFVLHLKEWSGFVAPDRLEKRIYV